MCRRFTYAVRHDLEALSDVHDKCAGEIGHVDPRSGFVEGLETLDVRG